MKNRKSYYVFIIKGVIALASLWIIYRQVVVKDDFRDTLDLYRDAWADGGAMGAFVVLFLMMMANWFLEALKWRFLLKRIESVSPGRALVAIVSGITVSFFTPNRIGEYAGRVLLLGHKKRIKAVIATVVGSMNQLLITVLAGTMALIFILRESMSGDRIGFMATAILLCAGLLFICVVYFNISSFYPWLGRFRLLRKADRFIKVLSYFHRRELATVTVFSVFRYIIFTVQFYVMLDGFGVSAEFLPAVRQAALMFLVMSVVPTFALSELTVRGSVALYCFASVTDNDNGIVAAAFSLWFINLVIPAVIGAFFLLFIKPIRESS